MFVLQCSLAQKDLHEVRNSQVLAIRLVVLLEEWRGEAIISSH